jgi:hypothetical protein
VVLTRENSAIRTAFVATQFITTGRRPIAIRGPNTVPGPGWQFAP